MTRAWKAILQFLAFAIALSAPVAAVAAGAPPYIDTCFTGGLPANPDVATSGAAILDPSATPTLVGPAPLGREVNFHYKNCTWDVGDNYLFEARRGAHFAVYGNNVKFTGGFESMGYNIETGSPSNLYLTFNNGSIWTLTTNSNMNSLIVNQSSLIFAPPSVNGYNTLTVGSYAGQGAVLKLNAVLGGTGSPSDEIIVKGGTATGTTSLTIKNIGGTGAQTTGAGIPLVVATNGGTIAANAFTLTNPKIVVGQYLYTLDSTPQEDSLVSQPVDTTTVQTQTTTVETTGQAGSSSIAVLKSRQSQAITGLQLGSILIGANEQVNCSGCASGFASVGSLALGTHGRWSLTDRLTLLAGLSYDEYSGRGYNVQSAPILAASLRYDLVDWGRQRPFFEVGGSLSPYGIANFSRNYASTVRDYTGYGSEIDRAASLFGRMGWVARVTPIDEIAAYSDLIGSWQYSPGYTEATNATNPFSASVSSTVYSMGIGKIGAQYTHLFNGNIEVNVNGALAHGFGPGYDATETVTGIGPISLSTTSDLNWAEFGARVGYRLSKNLIIDSFVLGTAGAEPVGQTLHGGMGLRYSF